MRFALAVAAGALVQAYAFTILTGPRGIPFVALLIMLLAALGAGFFAARRGVLAGIASLYAGALIYAGLSYVTGPPVEDAPRNALDVIGWGLRLAFAILPYGIGTALAGWAGSAARGRLLAWR
jgi:hypothetical protein